MDFECDFDNVNFCQYSSHGWGFQKSLKLVNENLLAVTRQQFYNPLNVERKKNYFPCSELSNKNIVPILEKEILSNITTTICLKLAYFLEKFGSIIINNSASRWSANYSRPTMGESEWQYVTVPLKPNFHSYRNQPGSVSKLRISGRNLCIDNISVVTNRYCKLTTEYFNGSPTEFTRDSDWFGSGFILTGPMMLLVVLVALVILLLVIGLVSSLCCVDKTTTIASTTRNSSNHNGHITSSSDKRHNKRRNRIIGSNGYYSQHHDCLDNHIQVNDYEHDEEDDLEFNHHHHHDQHRHGSNDLDISVDEPGAIDGDNDYLDDDHDHDYDNYHGKSRGVTSGNISACSHRIFCHKCTGHHPSPGAASLVTPILTSPGNHHQMRRHRNQATQPPPPASQRYSLVLTENSQLQLLSNDVVNACLMPNQQEPIYQSSQQPTCSGYLATVANQPDVVVVNTNANVGGDICQDNNIKKFVKNNGEDELHFDECDEDEEDRTVNTVTTTTTNSTGGTANNISNQRTRPIRESLNIGYHSDNNSYDNYTGEGATSTGAGVELADDDDDVSCGDLPHYDAALQLLAQSSISYHSNHSTISTGGDHPSSITQIDFNAQLNAQSQDNSLLQDSFLIQLATSSPSPSSRATHCHSDRQL